MNDINETFRIDLDLEGAVAEAPGQFLAKVDARTVSGAIVVETQVVKSSKQTEPG